MDKVGYNLTDFLHGLSGKQGDDIIKRGTTRDLKAQTVLFREGDPARQSYLVLKGRLKLGKVHELGKEVYLHLATSAASPAFWMPASVMILILWQ